MGVRVTECLEALAALGFNPLRVENIDHVLYDGKLLAIVAETNPQGLMPGEVGEISFVGVLQGEPKAMQQAFNSLCNGSFGGAMPGGEKPIFYMNVSTSVYCLESDDKQWLCWLQKVVQTIRSFEALSIAAYPTLHFTSHDRGAPRIRLAMELLQPEVTV